MKLNQLSAYTILEERKISDLNSVSYLLRHNKTGARIALLSNDDDNKVFYIGFRTPPQDSTGVAHILEHSVLCGSKKFPVKDPFVELVKGSLNTFLNAMTYPDKTIYPVASCNEKDFQNLLHVYLDAVFYPNIYQNENIFRQEGWHYALDEDTEELKISGVVYNEMKGAFSSPDDVLEREMMNSLYPDITYGCESGGDPEVIPSLTYEQFLDFHRKYYHPSNSYIYLYGNMDMAEKLQFIDEQYLSAFDALKVDSEIHLQPSFKGMNRVVREYPVSDSEKEEDNAYLAYNMSIGDNLDQEQYIAFQIMDYALCSAPGAPLKLALTDKGIGKDVYSIYENGIRQPYFSVIAKNADMGREQEFMDTIQEVLRSIAVKGFDQKALLAGINYNEFKYREADFGSYPKGLMYGLQILDSWLYDDNKPFIHVEANDTFSGLRGKVDQGYFEGLLRSWLLDNPHSSLVILKPVKGMMEQKEQEWNEALAFKRKGMSQEALQDIRSREESLLLFQETEDSMEDLMKIPLLRREDMKKEAAVLINEERKIDDIKVLYHDIFTNGIGYLRLLFKMDHIPQEYFPYIGVLKGVLGLLDTENYAYGDLFNEMNIITGGMAAVNNVYGNMQIMDHCTTTLEIKTKVLYENISRAVALMGEIILTSDFTDEKRLYEILAEGKSRLQGQLTSAGHSVAAGRAVAYGSKPAACNETLSGLSFYRLISSLEEHFEDKKAALIQTLTQLAQMIFRKENLMIDFVGTEEGYAHLAEPVRQLTGRLYDVPVETGSFIPDMACRNEGFMTAGQVQYVCRAGNFRKKGLPYRGDLRVLKAMMGYEYLWVNIRVKGGAYGCMCSFGRSGDSYFVSYRDPNLKNTIEIYENAAAAVSEFEADERTMTQYIIGAVSDLDTPLNPAAKGLFSLSAYMTGITQEDIQKERNELLAADPEGIRELSAYIDAFIQDGYLCVVGNAQRIKEEQGLFLHMENLL